MSVESGSGCATDENCESQGLNGFYIMVIGAMILVILTSLIFMCIIGISRYIQKRRHRYDLKDDDDGYLFDKPVLTSCEVKSPVSPPDTELLSPNTVMTEFSFSSSLVNSINTATPPVTPPIGEPNSTSIITNTPLMEALEAPTPQINEEPQEALQASIPSHISLPGAAKRKRARSNNYDHLIKVPSGGDAVMVFQNEAAMATETVHKEEEGMVEEVARERKESLPQTSLELSVDKSNVVKVVADHAREPVIIAGDKEAPLLSPAADNGAAPLPLALTETTQPQLPLSKTAPQDSGAYILLGDTLYTVMPENLPVSAQPIATYSSINPDSNTRAVEEYLHMAVNDGLPIQQPTNDSHLTGTEGLMAENALQAEEIKIQPGCEEAPYMIVLPDLVRSYSTPNIHAVKHEDSKIHVGSYDDLYLEVEEKDYCNVAQEYEQPIALHQKSVLSSQVDHPVKSFTPPLRKSLTLPSANPPPLPPPPAGQNRENVYMSLISHEIKTHDYDDPCPSANPLPTGRKHKRIPPRVARIRRPSPSSATSNMDYANISEWLKCMNARRAGTLGYTSLLPRTGQKKGDYDYALPT